MSSFNCSFIYDAAWHRVMENIKYLEDLILDRGKAFYGSEGPGVYPWEVPANTAYDLCCGDLSVNLFLQTR